MVHFVKKVLLHQQFHKLGVYGFGQLFNLVTPLIVMPYIVSVCGEANFGKTAVGMAIAFFLIVFVDFGSDIIGVREVSVNRDDAKKLNKIFTITYVVKAIILVLLVTITSLAFLSFSYFESEIKMFFLGLLILVGQFLNPTWFLQGIENVKWITILNIISKSIYLLGIFFTIKQESDYVYINMWWGIGMIISNSFVFLYIIKQHNFSFLKVKAAEVVSHIKNDFSMFSSQIFVSLQLYAPIVLVSYFGSNLMAGQYRIVEQIIVIFKTYIFLFFNYVFPKVCYLINLDYKKGIKNWFIFNGANLLFISSSMIVVHTFSYEIVSYFNPTNRYILSNLLQIAVFIPLTLAISIPLKQLILALNFKLFYVKLTSILVLFNLTLIIVLLPIFNVYGVFYSLIATDLLIIIFYLYKLKKSQKFL
jgi:O-antigen/teichoic acid export membrane protein